jgi:hypothetical protein
VHRLGIGSGDHGGAIAVELVDGDERFQRAPLRREAGTSERGDDAGVRFDVVREDARRDAHARTLACVAKGPTSDVDKPPDLRKSVCSEGVLGLNGWLERARAGGHFTHSGLRRPLLAICHGDRRFKLRNGGGVLAGDGT